MDSSVAEPTEITEEFSGNSAEAGGETLPPDFGTGPLVGEASAPGKVILFGEHAVVFGFPAIAAPLSRVVRVRLSSNGTSRNRIEDAAGDERLQLAVQAALSRFGLSGLDVSFGGDLPRSVGLGSSGALSAALARAASQAAAALGSRPCLAPDAPELLDAAMASERTFHGNPSGLDHTVSLTGKVIRFTRGAPFSPLSLPKCLSAVVWVVSERGSARERIARIGEMRAREPERVSNIFQEIGAIAEEAALSLERGAFEKLGSLMDRNHFLLSSLGLSTPELDAACDALRSAGAWGAKLTGAGGGGAVVALSDNADEVLASLPASARVSARFPAFAVRWHQDVGHESKVKSK